MPLPEPWLRGPLPGVPTFAAPLFYSFQMAREDLAQAAAPLAPFELWSRPRGLAPVGFHIRHIGRSVDRLTTYLQGQQLTAGQLDALHAELNPGAPAEELFAELHHHLDVAQQAIVALRPDLLELPRFVGRQALPTTVLGLLVHLAEHTQRHVGQAVTTARIVRLRSIW